VSPPRIGTVELNDDDVKLLDALHDAAEPLTSRILAERVGQPRNVVATRLGVLKRLDVVEHNADRTWRLAEAARTSPPWRSSDSGQPLDDSAISATAAPRGGRAPTAARPRWRRGNLTVGERNRVSRAIATTTARAILAVPGANAHDHKLLLELVVRTLADHHDRIDRLAGHGPDPETPSRSSDGDVSHRPQLLR